MKILIAKDQKTGRVCMFRFHDCDECNQKTGVKCVLKEDKLSDRYIMNCEDDKALLKKMVKDMNVKQVQIPRFEMCMECELRSGMK